MSIKINPLTGQFDLVVDAASCVKIEDDMNLYNAVNVEDALAEVMDKVTPVTYLADSIDTPTGTVTAGDVDSTKALNVDSYDVTEVTGSPGFDIRLTYQGITTGHEPNRIQLHLAYDGSVGHIVDLELWNYTGTPQFDVISADFITESGTTFIFYDIDIPGQITDYVSGSGESILRFNHTSAGNINHDFLIDFAALKDAGAGVGGITEHGALSGLNDDDHTQYFADTSIGVRTPDYSTTGFVRMDGGLGIGQDPTDLVNIANVGDTIWENITNMILDTDNTTALLIEQNGVNDNTLVVDTINARVGINKIPTTDLDINGDVLADNFEVSSSTAFYLGDKTTDGSWRIIRSGTDLVFERRETSSWVTKGSFVE